MKMKSLRLAAVIGILCCTFSLSTGDRAQALVNCTYVQGAYCQNPGQTMQCWWAGPAEPAECECRANHTWGCFYL